MPTTIKINAALLPPLTEPLPESAPKKEISGHVRCIIKDIIAYRG
jgi:hypothetical protein